MKPLFIATLFALFCPMLFPAVQGIEPSNYVEAHGGYRSDKFRTVIGTAVPNNFQLLEDILTARHLSIWETGLKAQAALDCHWFLKGYLYHGWITSGKFSNEAIFGTTGGYTNDFLFGIGYQLPLGLQIPFCEEWTFGLAPLAGWGYDEQVTRLHHANPSSFEKLKYHSIWNGPWFGFDLDIDTNDCMTFQVGYELHLAEWRGAWKLHHPVPTAFSDSRKGDLSFGQAFYINGTWNYSEDIYVSAEFKYQNWSTRGTGYLDSYNDAPFTSTLSPAVTVVGLIKKNYWYSCGFSLDLGYRF